MKRLMLTVLVTIALLSVGNVMGQDTSVVEQDQLTVKGRVKVLARADRATVQFKIKGEGKTLREAFGSARNRLEVIQDRLNRLGVEENSLGTSFFSSGENHGNKAFLSKKRDYATFMTVTVTTARFDLLEGILIILSEGGIESIDDVSFELVKISELRLDALRQATAKARQKAEIMSDALGVKCGRIIRVTETVPEPTRRYRMPKTVNPFNAVSIPILEYGTGSDGVFPSEIALECEVQLVYEIDNGELPIPAENI